MATKQTIYTNTDDINKFLSTIFATFSSVYAQKLSQKDTIKEINIGVIRPLYELSGDFCWQKSLGKLGVIISAHGGISSAGPFFIEANGEKSDVKFNALSFSKDGSWMSFYMMVFAKQTLQKFQFYLVNNMSVDPYTDPMYTWVSSDPIHEAIVGSMVSHLFDIGICPHVPKYMGLYICDIQTTSSSLLQGSPTFILEKSDYELIDILGGLWGQNRKQALVGIMDKMTEFDIIIWCIQIAHSIFVLKSHLGITHADLHLRNVMMTHIKNHVDGIYLPQAKITELMYDKKQLKDVDYFSYKMPFFINEAGEIIVDQRAGSVPAFIIVENNGFLPKIIDYGFTIMRLGRGLVDLPFTFANEPTMYSRGIFMDEVIKNYTIGGDLEYNYFILNLLYQLTRISINQSNFSISASEIANVNTFQILPTFIKETLPSEYQSVELKNERTSGGVKFSNLFQEINDSNRFFMRMRDVGTTSSILDSLVMIWMVLSKIPLKSGAPRVIRQQDAAYLMVSRNNGPMTSLHLSDKMVVVPYQTNIDTNFLGKYLKYTENLWKYCITKKLSNPQEIQKLGVKMNLGPNVTNIDQFCTMLKSEERKYLPMAIFQQPFYQGIIDQTSPLWDARTNSIRGNLTLADFNLAGIRRILFPRIALHSFRINPGILKMGEIAQSETFTYQKDQRLLNYQSPPIGLLGTNIQAINVHLLYVAQNTAKILAVEKQNLLVAAEQRLTTRGVSVNGGYFIVPYNTEDPLNINLDNKRTFPIGYFYSQITPEYNGTILPVPSAYQQDFATIYFNEPNGKIQMERSPDFLERHHQETRVVFLELGDPPKPGWKLPHKSNPEQYPPSTLYATERKVIKMENRNGVLTPLVKDPSFQYTSAFESGPILIWEGKIIFSRTKMKTQEFKVNLYKQRPVEALPPPQNKLAKVTETPSNFTPYRVVTSAANHKMYFNEEGEFMFPLGQRHSNNLMIHNVMCETYEGHTLFVFIEGRGYGAPGIDRAQLAELVSKFNVKNAVSLDGGFSANAVFKSFDPATKKGQIFWLISDPTRVSISTVLHFQDPI